MERGDCSSRALGIRLQIGQTPAAALMQLKYSTVHYIILNNGILKSNSTIFPWSKGFITQYTPWGLYGLIVDENNEVNISLMIVKII